MKPKAAEVQLRELLTNQDALRKNLPWKISDEKTRDERCNS